MMSEILHLIVIYNQNSWRKKVGRSTHCGTRWQILTLSRLFLTTCTKNGEPEQFHGRSIFMLISMTSYGDTKNVQLVVCMVNVEWRSEFSLWTKTILISRSQTWTTRTKTTTSRKLQKYSSKGQPQRRFLQVHTNNTIGGTTRIFAFWLFSVQEIDQSSFFVLVVYFEKMMERLNSGESKNIFTTILCILNIGLMKSGKVLWPNEEETGKDSSIVLILQETFFTSELFLQGHSGRNFCDLSLQDNVLIPDGFFKYILSRRMCNQFTLHHKFRIDSGRTKFQQGQTDGIFLQPWIPCIRITKIRKCLIWPSHVLHRTSHYTVRWVDIQIVQRKDWSSIKQDRTKLSSTIHSQFIVSRKQLRWILKKSYTRECICHFVHHRQFPSKIIGCAIWILNT